MRESSEMARRKKETVIPTELLDKLLEDYERPEDLLGKDGILDQLKKAVMERALGAELTEHLVKVVKVPGTVIDVTRRV